MAKINYDDSRRGIQRKEVRSSELKDYRNGCIEEPELLERIKNGDEQAFDFLFFNYRGKLYHFLQQSLPDEFVIEGIVQEVFIRVWLKRDQLDVKQGIQPFLFTIAKNLLKDQLRKKLVRQKYLSNSFSREADLHSSPDKHMEYAELEKSVMDYISNMPERRRYIFELSRNDGKTYVQIATELGISVNTVDTHIRKALQGLRKLLYKSGMSFFCF